MYVRVGVREGDFIGETEKAIQAAVNAVVCYGGGTVEIGAGHYLLNSSIRLGRNIRLVGAGSDTILQKGPATSGKIIIDADYGQMKITVDNASGFLPGMEIVVADDKTEGYFDSVAKVTLVQGNTIYLDRALIADYAVSRNAEIWNGFSLVSAQDVDSVIIEGLTLDGCRRENKLINGCIGGGIYFYRARKCRISDCIVLNFAGDGISYQTTQEVVVERCEVGSCVGIGIHPGTGTEQTIVRDCKLHHNDEDGLYLCYRVQGNSFEGNEIFENGQYGISIGHKDTDNVFLSNRISRNKSHGICFREETPSNSGSRNIFRRNVIEDNGDCGVYIGGFTSEVLFEENTIKDTRTGMNRTQRIGLFVGDNVGGVTLRDNHIDNNIEAAVHGKVQAED